MAFELLVATKNKKKLKEIKAILSGLNLKIVSLSDLPEKLRIVENGKTFKANAVKKAVEAASFSQKLALGEDSGLCVKALGGRPGVYSSRFAGKGKSDRLNNAKLLKLLDGLGISKRKAYYSCAVALADADGIIGVVQGKCYGYIGFAPRGHFGFGYDPLFIVPGYNKTFAELGGAVKHKMSHRFVALKKAAEIIQKYIERRSSS